MHKKRLIGTGIILFSVLPLQAMVKINRPEPAPRVESVEYTAEDLENFIDRHNLGDISALEFYKLLKKNNLDGLHLDLLDKLFEEHEFDGFGFVDGLVGPKENPLEILSSENLTIE